MQALTVLLESGISVNHVNGESQSTLLHMAAYCGQVGRRGCDSMTDLSPHPPQLPVVAYLLSLEANLKAVDKDNDTVLHFACMKEVSHGMHDRTLQLLLNTPAKSLINKQNSKGDTPIMVATRYVLFVFVAGLVNGHCDYLCLYSLFGEWINCIYITL